MQSVSTTPADPEIAAQRNKQTVVARADAPMAEQLRQKAASPLALMAAHLYKTYGKRCVVDDVDLHVEKGEVVGLLGANGAGKTTTFYMIIGLEQPDAGTVRLGDRDLTRLPIYL